MTLDAADQTPATPSSRLWSRARSIVRLWGELEERPCPLCGSAERWPVVRYERFFLPIEVAMCRGCGFVYAARMFDAAGAEQHHHRLRRLFRLHRNAGARGDVRIARRIDHHVGQHRLAARLVLDDDAPHASLRAIACDGVAVGDDVGDPAVEQDLHARFFEQIDTSNVDLLEHIYSPDAFFKDPFNEVHGIEAITGIFQHMFDQVDSPRFVVTTSVLQGDQA